MGKKIVSVNGIEGVDVFANIRVKCGILGLKAFGTASKNKNEEKSQHLDLHSEEVSEKKPPWTEVFESGIVL